MSKVTLYSRSVRSRAAADAAAAATAAPPPPPLRQRAAAFVRRHERALWISCLALLIGGIFAARPHFGAAPRELTQEDIDAAVLHTLDTNVAAVARREGVRGGARVGGARARHRATTRTRTADRERGVGTGVVIVDTGVILTNLHVVAGADRIKVRVLRRHRVGGRR